MHTNTAENNGPAIGIDFGTTKTMVAEYDVVNEFAMVRKIGRGADEMPSSMYVTTEGEVLFGDAADDLGINDFLKHIVRFKMLLGKTTKTNFGDMKVKGTDLVAKFLTNLHIRLENEVCRRSVEQVVLTVPTMFGPAAREDLKIAAERAGFKRIELLHEPVAAGIAYCNYNTNLPANLRFLVVDWGGGTFDVALVERTAEHETRIISHYVGGLDDIGGEVIDDHLWSKVSDSLVGAGCEALYKQKQHHLGNYRREITRSKERLSEANSVKMIFTLDGDIPVTLDFQRSYLEEAIAETVSRAATFVSTLYEQCRSGGYPPEFILLVGGTSKIPMIKRVFEEKCRVECRSWSQGREAIAIGAALHAQRLWFSQKKSAPANTIATTLIHAPSAPEGKVILTDYTGLHTPSSPTGQIHQPKQHAMSVYRSMVKITHLDGAIPHEKQVWLEEKRNELGLSQNEAESIQIEIMGSSLTDFCSKSNYNTGKLEPQVNIPKPQVNKTKKSVEKSNDSNPLIEGLFGWWGIPLGITMIAIDKNDTSVEESIFPFLGLIWGVPGGIFCIIFSICFFWKKIK